MPGPTDDLLNRANQAHVSGKLTESESFARQALALEPENPQIHLLLGVLTGKTGRPDLAIEHFEKVLVQIPHSFESLFWLSMLERQQKHLDVALSFALKALELRPNDAFANNNLGMCYMDLLRLEEAIVCFQKAASVRADMAPIFYNLGTALYLVGRDLDSAKAFDLALAIAPHSIESFLSLGQVLISQTNPEAAIVCAKKAIALNSKSATAQLLMASALVENGQADLAEDHLKRAVALDPQDAKAHALLGQRYQSMGRFEEANHHLRESMKLEPKQGFAYFAYVHNNKVSEQDRPLVETMERLVTEGGLPPREMDFLYYGLGKAFEGLKEYEKAMANFDEANRLARKIKFGDMPFDRTKYSRSVDWMIETFTEEFIQKHRPLGNPSSLPIVIVGMMRSGTTLAEQILSSHPAVAAAGEHRFWPKNAPTIFGAGGQGFRADTLRHYGERYVQALKAVAPAGRHVTDKMPANYEYLGPIHLALPNARIIHMRRHPLDTCVSIYATPNRVPVDYAYDRANIVFAYQEYLRLMEHWRFVLPEDRFIEVNYEDVVSDRQTQIERMLKLIGLEWDDALLHHEQNRRNVNTPSLWQVRQPIYTSSVERWKRYEPWLEEFRNLL